MSESTVTAGLRAQGLLPVAEDIAKAHWITCEQLLGRGKTAAVARARAALYVELRKMAFSYPEIGRLLDRDHTTVMAACRGMNVTVPLRGVVKVGMHRPCGMCGERYEDHLSREPHALPRRGCVGFAMTVAMKGATGT